jgi:hypothetical protein
MELERYPRTFETETIDDEKNLKASDKIIKITQRFRSILLMGYPEDDYFTLKVKAKVIGSTTTIWFRDVRLDYLHGGFVFIIPWDEETGRFLVYSLFKKDSVLKYPKGKAHFIKTYKDRVNKLVSKMEWPETWV